MRKRKNNKCSNNSGNQMGAKKQIMIKGGKIINKMLKRTKIVAE